MHLLCSLVVAVMALFPGSAGEGGLNLRAWMESYEKYLYQQMYDNIENARRNEEICNNSAKNEVLHEQTAGKKVAVTNSAETIIDETLQQSSSGEETERHEHEESAVLEEPKESYAQPISTVETSAPMESESTNIQEATPLYAVNGAVLDIGVQEYLYQRLCEANIGWFYQYAILIAYQESRFYPLAVNPNGKDFGLFQFRLQYHPDLDWSNPYAQVDRFVLMMANRANNGKTAAEMISAHNQSDYGPYCQEYVSIVMSHEAAMVQIR